ncbi:MAG: hypothetical protein SOV66_04935, partial [Sodaliphilus sp.]|nr:hypothetical protein [Sodaliphilus sp.]
LELTGARTKFANQNVGTCLWHVSMQTENYQRITQHAEGMSLRQMRSIPRCSKAVFYVFVFDSIHDLATMQNIPRTFPLSLLST